jgi:hypothetical protein
MHIYRFRVLIEDNDQFFREIDVKANQTFEDFHNALVTSAGFDNNEMASFYICDSKWNKQQEICLCDMSIPEEDNFGDDEEDEVQAKKKRVPIMCMAETYLKDIIIDPHQRIIYVYDFLKLHTFYIELYKILPAEHGKKYPSVGKSVGKIIKAPDPNAVIDDKDVDEDETELLDLGELSDVVEPEDQIFEGFYDDSSN